jgi:hypothetical protein
MPGFSRRGFLIRAARPEIHHERLATQNVWPLRGRAPVSEVSDLGSERSFDERSFGLFEPPRVRGILDVGVSGSPLTFDARQLSYLQPTGKLWPLRRSPSIDELARFFHLSEDDQALGPVLSSSSWSAQVSKVNLPSSRSQLGSKVIGRDEPQRKIRPEQISTSFSGVTDSGHRPILWRLSLRSNQTNAGFCVFQSSPKPIARGTWKPLQ